ncbi:MAG: hypothetical protein N3E51_05310, partial [Candidatus Micrarchaeota archaeon]|nr:hypothetical protein [Candidatus Micrarchaeota archaeon]
MGNLGKEKLPTTTQKIAHEGKPPFSRLKDKLLDKSKVALTALSVAAVLSFGKASWQGSDAKIVGNANYTSSVVQDENRKKTGEMRSKDPIDSLYATVNITGKVKYLTAKELQVILNSLDKSTFTAMLVNGGLLIGDKSGMKVVTNFGSALLQAGLPENYTANSKPILATMDGYMG